MPRVATRSLASGDVISATISGRCPRRISNGAELCAADSGHLRVFTRYQRYRHGKIPLAFAFEDLPATEHGKPRPILVVWR